MGGGGFTSPGGFMPNTTFESPSMSQDKDVSVFSMIIVIFIAFHNCYRVELSFMTLQHDPCKKYFYNLQKTRKSPALVPTTIAMIKNATYNNIDDTSEIDGLKLKQV